MITEDRHNTIRDMIDELCNLESGLTNWEMDFIDSLCDWDGRFTEKQADKLEAIYEKLI